MDRGKDGKLDIYSTQAGQGGSWVPVVGLCRTPEVPETGMTIPATSRAQDRAQVCWRRVSYLGGLPPSRLMPSICPPHRQVGPTVLGCVQLCQCSDEHHHRMCHTPLSARVTGANRPDEQPSSSVGRRCRAQPVPGPPNLSSTSGLIYTLLLGQTPPFFTPNPSNTLTQWAHHSCSNAIPIQSSLATQSSVYTAP
jgi:hypothetical protein